MLLSHGVDTGMYCKLEMTGLHVAANPEVVEEFAWCWGGGGCLG